MKRKLISTLTIFLLALPVVFADDVSVTVRIADKIETLLAGMGTGIGNLFTGMGVPLMIFVILMALGSMVGYIMEGIGKSTGDKI